VRPSQQYNWGQKVDTGDLLLLDGAVWSVQATAFGWVAIEVEPHGADDVKCVGPLRFLTAEDFVRLDVDDVYAQDDAFTAFHMFAARFYAGDLG
jgi:hypothetical protein